MLIQSRIKKVLLNPYLLLFVITLVYYSLYLFNIFLNLNTLLSSSIDDSLKNYFTYVYQIKNSSSALHFEGFNYPFGEHVVYTDCQPLLTFILRLLPFTHNYSIGILHFLMFVSILITPLVYLAIFRKLSFPYLASFAVALGITVLSPQYFRVYCGHYALAYACIIPCSILLLLRYFQSQKNSSLILIFCFNSLLFLIHPYYGLGLSLFSFIGLTFFLLFQKRKRMRLFLNAVLIGLMPIVLFRLFMLLSDQHTGRSPMPFGNDDFISEIASFLVPYFGPFSKVLTQIVGSFPQHFEGYAYLGLGLILLIVLSLPLMLLYFKKLKADKGMLGLLIASVFFLFFSFGLQYKLQELLGIKLTALNQFRAMGRFSWFLYYVLPLVFFHVIYELLKQKFSYTISLRSINAAALVFLSINLYEGHAYFKLYDGVMWEDRNIFNPAQLNKEEAQLLEAIKEKKAQAIIPLPIFYFGSEVYERTNFTIPMFLSALYSYHSGLPIQSGCMSRTSVSETRAGINLLNSYKRQREGDSQMTTGDFFVIKTQEPLYEDEKRVWKITQPYLKNDSTAYGFVAHKDLHLPILDPHLVEIKNKNHYSPDTLGIISLIDDTRKPFLPASPLNYEMVYETDTSTLKSGTYILSFHYHTADTNYIGTANAMVVAKKRGKEYNWQEFVSFKSPSGFGPGYSILEYRFDVDGRYAYEFFIHGGDDFEYRVSNFLLRPENISVRVITSKNDTLLNNFPR